MATKLGSLLIELGLDSAKFRSGARQAQREMSTMQRGMTGSANLIKGAIGGMVAALSVDMFATAIKDGLEYASSLGEVAQQLGVTTDTLQEYRYAATQAGLSQDEMDNSLAKLTRTIGQAANGGKAQVAAFERLGVSIRDANGNIKEAGVVIPEIADGLKRLSSDAERAATLTELFGRAGQKLAPLLAGGSEGINNLRDAAHRLGIVLSSEQIQSADDAADKLAAVQTVLKARLAGAVADNAASIIEMANALSDLADKAFRAWAAIRRFADSDVGRAMMAVSRFADNIGPRGAIDRAYGAVSTYLETTQPRPTGRPSAAPATPAAPVRRPSSNGDLLFRRGTRFLNDDQADMSLNGAPAAAAAVRNLDAAVTAVRPTLRAATPEVTSLLAQLFPVQAARNELAANIRLLDAALRANQITVQTHRAAVATLRAEFGKLGEGMTDWRALAGDVSGGFEVEVDSTESILSGLADHWEDESDRMQEAAEKSKQALFDTLGSIRNFANSLKSGDIIGIFEGVLGILEGIGGLTGGFNIGGMKFGTGASSRIPGFATGTNFAPGGLAWVGERGRELVNLPRGSQVVPNHELKGLGGAQVQIIPSPYFDVVVDGRVQQAAPSIASAGSQGAQSAMARRQSRMLA